jgi:hypothetical protein
MNSKHFILIKFATRSRPLKFFKGLENIISKAKDKDNFGILVSADIDDKTMWNSNIIQSLIPYVEKGYVFIIFGKSKNKIDAINRDIDKTSSIEKLSKWDILINFSDDMEFLVEGYDDIIRDKFNELYPDTDGNIYFNDGFTADKISTMSIMGRKYYERFNYIYNPEYISLWCDNEYTEVAKILNKITYFPNQIYVHNHPTNIIGLEIDELLIKTQSYFEVDGKTYYNRKLRNFDLKL